MQDDPEKTQSAVVRFLADPRTHGGLAVEEIVTPISRIFLAGARAYKLRRAVRTNFLDFTSSAARETDCHREIAVNRAAPTLYLGVRAITDAPGGLQLDGPGTARDWVVEMRRFDRNLELDRLADRQALPPGLVDRLADIVARMHGEAPVSTGHGGFAGCHATILQIADALKTLPGPAYLQEDTGRWCDGALALAEAHRPRLEARRRHGRVRRGHGDLHLGNIVMLDGVPTPFDALEFSDAMATTDIAYDLAFLLMDLVDRGHPALAGRLRDRYLSAVRDHSGLALMPLFISMRAAVRALVAAASGDRVRAKARLSLAQMALTARPEPRVICVGGLSGTGKSTLARSLSPDLAALGGAIVQRSDVARKRLFGVAPEAPLGPEGYEPGISERVYERLLREAGHCLRAGWPVILDATFLKDRQRVQAERLALRYRVPMEGLWLTAPLSVLEPRLAGRSNDASDADVGVLKRQMVAAPSQGRWRLVDASGSPETTLDVVRQILAKTRAD